MPRTHLPLTHPMCAAGALAAAAVGLSLLVAWPSACAARGGSAGPHRSDAGAAETPGQAEPVAGRDEELAVALAEARALLADGAPEDALLAVDRALALDPESSEALALRARGSLLLAESLAARGAGGLHVEAAFTDALRAFEALPPGPEASLGASRAALSLGRSEEALARARRAMAALAGEEDEPEGVLSLEKEWLLPEKVWSEAAFARYLAVRGTGAAPDPEASADEIAALYLETEDALARRLGRTPADPLAWQELANLRQWGGDLTGARQALESAVARAPGETAVLDRLRDVARLEGGATAAVAALDRIVARHPDSVHARFSLGVARFERAVELRGQSDPDAAELLFVAAENSLAAARAADAAYAEACLAWEVVCRAGVGWCCVDRKDAGAGVRAFSSMEELFEGGILWRIEGSVASGVEGLAWCGDILLRAGELERAAQLFDRCRAYEPGDLRWANGAAYLHRDHAIALELEGRRLCAEGRADEANVLYEEARAHMRACWEAYLQAVEIAPDDVRIVNDAALVPVYYLHELRAEGEAQLLRALALGEAQLAEEALGEEQRVALLSAWGDVHQNLGVLALVRDGDIETAREWFDKSVEIGPAPEYRGVVTGVWLPKCDDADVDNEESLAAAGWAVPCE